MNQRLRLLFSTLIFLLVSSFSKAQSSIFFPPDTVNPTCLGIDNGSVNFNFTGNAGDFFFSWSGGNLPTNGNPISGDGLVTQTGLRAADYFVFIQDNNTGFDTTIFISLKNQRTVVVNAGNDINNCLGQPVNLSATSNAITGSVFQWNYVSTSGPKTLTGQNVSIPASPSTNSLTSSGPVSVLVTDPSGCSASNIINVTVNIPPTGAANPTTQTICSGPLSVVLSSNQSGTTYTWTTVRSGVAGAVPGSGLGINQNVRATGTANGTVTYNIRPVSTAGCVGPVFTSQATILPKPVITSTPDSAGVCSGIPTAFVLGSSLTPTTFHWFATGSQVSGFSNDSGSVISQTLTATGITNGKVIYKVSGTSNGCKSDSIRVVATVKPIPVVTVNQNDTLGICPGQSITFNYSSNTLGSSFFWTVKPNGAGAIGGSGSSNSQTYSNPGNTILNADFSAFAVANACSSKAKEHRVKVFPSPVIGALTSSDSICTGDSIRIQLVSNLPNTSFSWTSTANGLTGNSNGNGDKIKDELIATGLVIGDVTYTINGTTPDCPGVQITKKIYVKPRPIISSLPFRDTLCSGNATSFAFSSNLPGTIFNWTVQPGNITGASAGTGNLIQQLLVNPVSGTDSATYTIVGSYRSCAGPEIKTKAIVVRSAPPVPSDPAPVVCSGTPLQVELSPNSNWNWRIKAGSAIGAIAGSGTSFNQTLINTGVSDKTLVYSIFGSISECPTDTLFLPVLVKPLPKISAIVAEDSICSGQSVHVDLSALPSDNVAFSWSVESGNVIGASAGSGATINQNLSLISGNLGSVTYHILAERAGCIDSVLKKIVVSNPDIPFNLNPVDSSLCDGDSVIIVLSAQASGLTYNWTATSSNVNGASAGTGNQIRQKLSLADAAAGNGFVDYTVTPISGPCAGIPRSKRIAVNNFPAIPLVAILSGSSPICPGDSMLLSSSAVSGNQWIRNGQNIPAPKGIAPGLTVLDSGNYAVRVTNLEGCGSNSASVRVDRRPLPAKPIISGPLGICAGASVRLHSNALDGNQWQLNGVDILGASDTFLVISQAGNYSIRLSNSICKVVSDVFAVSQFPAVPQPIISGPANFCASGTATLNSSSSLPSRWFRNGIEISGATGQSLVVNQSGAYSVLVSDANACSISSADFSVTADPVPAPSTITGPNAICLGAEATLSASANSNYKWLLDGVPVAGANLQTISISEFGTYSVVVNLGTCSDTSLPFTVVQTPANFTVDTNIVAAGCQAGIPANNGQISLVVQAGSGNYSFNWSNNLPNQATQSNLAPSTYSVLVKDLISGCISNLENLVVPAPPVLVLGSNLINDSRCDIDNGSISITPAGSPGPFGFVWTGRPETSSSITGLASGTYEVVVTDISSGCVRTLSGIQIGGPDSVEVVATKKNVTCSGPGSILLTVSGGSAQYSYDWSGTGTGLVAGAANQNSISAGIYQVTVRDINSRCSRTISGISIQAFDSIAISIQKNNPSTCNASNGSATAITGIASANYRWKNAAGIVVSTDSIASGLTSGNYRLVVSSGICRDSAEFNLSNPAIVLQTNVSQISGCGTNDGSINLQVSGQTGQASFAWTKNGLPFSSNQNITGLQEGIYAVVVQASACSSSASVTINPSSFITYSKLITAASNCTSSDGSIRIIPVGNASGLHFAWFSLPLGLAVGGDSARLVSAKSGFYRLLITNGACVDSAKFLVPALAQPDVQSSLVLPGFCKASNGKISILDSAQFAGQTAVWYQNGQALANGFNLKNVAAGTFQLLITNNLLGGPLSCTQSYEFVLPDGSGLGLSVTTDSADCFNINGKALILSAANNSGFTYSWTKFGDPTFTGSGNNQGNLSVGLYKVKVNGPDCSDSISFSIYKRRICQPCDIAIVIYEQQPSSCSSSDGALVAWAVGVQSGATYTWFNVSTGVIVGNDDTLRNIPAGRYRVVVNKDGCSAFKEYDLKKTPVPFTISPLGFDASCANNDGRIVVSLAGVSNAYSISIKSLATGTIVSDSLSADSLSAGIYRVKVSDGSCSDSLELEIKKPVFCGPCNLQAEAASNPVTCPGLADGRAFGIVISGGIGPFQYILNDADTLTQTQFLQIFPNQPIGPFKVEIRDLATQCKDTVRDFIGSVYALTAAVTTLANDCDTVGAISLSLGGAPGPFTVFVSGDTLISGGDTIRTVYSDTLLVSGNDTSITGIKAGAYQIHVISSQGCKTKVSGILLKLRVPVELYLGKIKPVTCAGNNNGAITIDSLAGSDTYQYFIPGLMTDYQPLLAGQTISNLSAGTFLLRIKGNRSCDLDTSITISGPDPLQFLIQGTAPSTCADSAGTAKVTFLAGGNGKPYTYDLLLNGSAFRSDTLSSDSIIANLPPGSYSMILYDTSLCAAAAVFTIESIKLQYALNLSADTNKICSGDTIRFTASTTPNIPGMVYNWFVHDTLYTSSGPLQNIPNLNNADQVYVEVSPDPNCFIPANAQSQIISIQVTPAGAELVAGVIGIDTLVCAGGIAVIQAQNPALIPDVSYTWFVNGIEQLNQSSDVLNYVPLQAVDTVQLVMTALSGAQCLSKSVDTSRTILVYGTAPGIVKDSLVRTSPGTNVFLCPNTPVTYVLGTNLKVPFRVDWYANGVLKASGTDTSYTFTGLSGSVRIRAVVKFDSSLACLAGNGPAGIDSSLNYVVQFLPANDPRCLPCALDLRAEVQNLSCGSNADGKITATVTGGTGAYVYKLIPGIPAGTTASVFANLLPGVYTITVRDTITQCVDTLRNVNVVSQHNYAVSLGYENSSSCLVLADGKIEVLGVEDGSGNSGKYLYSLIPGYPAFTSQTLFENLVPDTFQIRVKDTITGCITSITKIITRKDPVDGFISLISGVNCHGGSDAKVKVDSILHGSGLYQFSLSGAPGSYVPVQAGDTLEGFAAGLAFVYIRDLKTGCVDSNQILVPEPAQLVFGLQLTDTSSCISNTGKVKISGLAGGTSPYSFQYQLPDSSGFDNFSLPSDSIISNLGGGLLIVRITDSKGCFMLDSIQVPVDRPVIGNIKLISPCIGDTNGIIRLSEISGGLAPYLFTLTNGFGAVVATQSDTVFSGLSTGIYSISIKDASGASGCENVYIRALLPSQPLRFNLVRFKESTCNNFDGEAVFALSGGQRPYRFSFDSLAAQFTNFALVAGINDTLKISGLSARAPGEFYSLKIRDNGPDGGCNYDTSFVQPGQAPLQYAFSSKNIICYGEASGSVTLSEIRGTGPIVLTVKRIGSDEIVAQDTLEGSYFQNSTFELGGIPAGDFNLEVLQFGVCNGSKSIPFGLSQPPEIIISTRMFRKSAQGFQLGSILMDSIKGGFQPYLVSFNGGAQFSYHGDSLFRHLNPGAYSIRVQDDTGCVLTNEFVCLEDEALFVPTLFTPNGDGLNDKLEIRNLPAGSRFVVKDRWGKEVFASGDYKNDWDGKDLETGNYFWILDMPGLEGKSGWVMIER